MYTQCPECNSIFEITATDLAVAGGFVRCGQCSSSFDALNSLSDNPDAIKATVAKSKAKSALDKVKSKARPAVPNKKARMPAKLTRRRKPNFGKPTIATSTVVTDPDNVIDDAATDIADADVVLRPDTDDTDGQEHTYAANDTPLSDRDSETDPLPDDAPEALSNDAPDFNEVDAPSKIADAGETDTAEIDSAEIDSAEIDSAEIASAEIDTAESDNDEIADDNTDDQNGRVAAAIPVKSVDDDEILLDEEYQSPYSADDESYLDDDPVDPEQEEIESVAIVIPDPDDLAEAIECGPDDPYEDKKPDEERDEDLPDNNLLGKDKDIDVDSHFETFIDDDLETDLTDESGIDADSTTADANTDDSVTDDLVTDDLNADDEGVDESVLFALPLPELTALEPSVRGLLPEKLEGGEAAHDPSAQSPATQPVKQTQPMVTQRSPYLTSAKDAYDAEDARDLKEYLEAPTNRWATAAWLSGSVLMVLLLIGQFVHRHRGDLVTHPRLGPVVSSIYDTVGADLRPTWQINQYEIVGDARLFLMPNDDANDEQGDDAGNIIRFVAIISNGANRPQPAPMVRLTLRDRWGDATGARDFTPPEYLADRALIGRMLEPGQRLRVILNLRDQGAEAVGFDFDMCLPDGAGTLRCNNEDAG